MVNPPLDLLTRGSFADLAAALRRTTGDIIARWEAATRKRLPHADEPTLTQLRDELPSILEQIASTLTTGDSEAPEPWVAGAPETGAARFHARYDLNEALIAHHILRTIVWEQASQQLGRALAIAEASALAAGVETVARRTAVAFAQHLSFQAQRAKESQGEFLSFLSHDLRGGLNGIFLMIELLKRELAAQPDASGTVDDLNTMRRSILDTIARMDQSLQVERFRQGRVQLKPSRVNLRSLLGQAAAQYAPQAKEKGIGLEIEAPQPMEFTSDPELLTLILENLVANAVKYTTKGSVRIRAAAAEGSDSGWRIEVCDDGPGIPPEKLAELFGPVVRDMPHRRTGNRLAIARQAAQVLGAKLWAESQLGQGCTFFLQIYDASHP